ncbi:MAG: protein translocase subunit SecD [Chloroflexota bacterium]|nr:protein translocase subunit SecD [Chloroflexota bacterium]
MPERNLNVLIGIILLMVAAIWVDWPTNPGLNLDLGPLHIHRDIRVHQGLDLQGGLQVLLEADVPVGQEVTADDMTAARVIVENRVDGLGVMEPLVQKAGERRIIVELPGIENPERAIATLRETGLLEFIDAGATFLPPGTRVHTTYGGSVSTPVTDTTPVTATSPVTGMKVPDVSDRVFTTALTGRDLAKAALAMNQYGKPEIRFQLKPAGAEKFRIFTASHVGQFLAIVMDKQVISCPRIQSAIPDGSGRITGRFSLEEARSLAIQLKYGALPVPLKVVENRLVGPTLGQDSVQKSIRAGTIGLAVVLLFMLAYYRLPGLLADLALILYALLNFAFYKLIPVTLTLPAIAGFLLSIGMAVDANILVFERIKEELRGGQPLRRAAEAGFSRAWSSIRDSDLSSLITCAILFWFGSNFGASIVKGFAITLALGMIIDLFTAIIVTRALIRFVFYLGGEELRGKHWLLGV